jgi:hypothetical protein
MKDRASRIPADQQSKLRDAGNRIVSLYKEWSKPVQAEEWQQRIADRPIQAAR